MLLDFSEEEGQAAEGSPARLLRPLEACHVYPFPPVVLYKMRWSRYYSAL
jgi:hypothetical protein